VTHVLYEADGWGVGELVVADERVVWHELPWPRPNGTGPRGPGATGDPSQTPSRPGHRAVISGKGSRGGGDFVAEVLRLLSGYFSGEAVALDRVPLDLDYETDFLRSCAEALRSVPRGEVVTYGELAALAGAPGAARAAGSFCARNRLGLFIPCHRVVAAGGLGSYGSHGLAYKRRLLELEGWSRAL
jgi:O-6-methylguanine DNA methyltransferase